MRLESCHICGVVVNMDILEIPEKHNEDGNIISENVYFSPEKPGRYYPIAQCPVCKTRTFVFYDE